MTQIPAGWYPDPAPAAPGQPPSQRYWDGQAWTAHVQPLPAYAGPQPYGATQPYGVAQPYGVPQPSSVATTPDGAVLAGWWQRVGAYLLDAFIVGIAASIVTVPLQLRLQRQMTDLMTRFQPTDGRPPDFGAFFSEYLHLMRPLLLWSALTGFVLWCLYSGIFLRTKGATPGKMVLGLAVRLRERPGQLPWSAIARRLLVQQGVALLAFLPLLYVLVSWFPALDGLWAAFDGKRQALHDKAAGTNVIRTR